MNESQSLVAPTECAKVAVLSRARSLDVLYYSIPDYLRAGLMPGVAVLVPVRTRMLTGLVLEVGPIDVRDLVLKPIAEILDPIPILDSAHLMLLRFAASYYLAPLVEVCRLVVPSLLRVETKKVYKLACNAAELDEASLGPSEKQIIALLSKRPLTLSQLKRQLPEVKGPHSLSKLLSAGLIAEKNVLVDRARRKPQQELKVVLNAEPPTSVRGRVQRRVLEILSCAPNGELPLSELEAMVPGVRRTLSSLIARGFIQLVPVSTYSTKPNTTLAPSVDGPRLTDEQEAALRLIVPAIIEKRNETFLLWGVTGSGKTEVYLNLARRCLETGRTTLVLIPEIGLTEHLVGAFQERFGEQVTVFHSAQLSSQKWEKWKSIRQGAAKIVIGPRSAIFAPLQDLGLIIVDEEHDVSYKQEEGVRYNARDLAVVLGRFCSCPVVLGSATPSAESYVNARRGRYRLVKLERRVLDRPMPLIEVVDLRREWKYGAKSSESSHQGFEREDYLPLSETLLEALRANLTLRQQSIIFVNRRGYHTALQCRFCGLVISCENCSVCMHFHLRDRSLLCHYCGERKPAPRECPDCGALAFEGHGFGTERIVSALTKLFPQARIERMDSDVTRRRKVREQLLERLAAGDIDILVGTQMITKGFDFPRVSVVGVVLAEQTLSLPDFRAAERTFQLLTQVAGRAGRGEIPGRVLIQTYVPYHYTIRAVQVGDYARFMRRELELRRTLGYPPFVRLALVRFEGRDESKLVEVAKTWTKILRDYSGANELSVLGPSPAPIERLNGRYRWQILIKSPQVKALQEAIRFVHEQEKNFVRGTDVRVVVDVDPVNML